MFLLFAILLFVLVRYYKKKGLTPSLFVIFVFLLSSGMTLVYAWSGDVTNQSNLFTDIYYILNLLFFYIPLLNNNIVSKEAYFPSQVVSTLSYILIISGGITLWSVISNINLAETIENWSSLRDEYYSTLRDMTVATSFSEKVQANFIHILPLSIPLFVYNFIKGDKVKAIALLIVSFALVLYALTKAERQGLLVYMSDFIFSILFFKDRMSKAFKQKIITACGVTLSLIVAILIAITISRFGDKQGGILDSLFGYGGAQPVNAAMFLEEIEDQKLNGQLNFPYLVDKELIVQINDYVRSPHYLNVFGSIVGSFYIDFGYTSIIYVILFVLVFHNVLRYFKRTKSFAYFYLYYLYYQIMFLGVFYYGYSSPPLVRIIIIFLILIVLLEIIAKKYPRRNATESIYNSFNLQSEVNNIKNVS